MKGLLTSQASRRTRDPLRQHTGRVIAINHCRHGQHCVVANDNSISNNDAISDYYTIANDHTVTDHDSVGKQRAAAKNGSVAHDDAGTLENRVSHNHAIADFKRIIGFEATNACIGEFRRAGRTETYDGVEYVTFAVWEVAAP